MTLLSNNPRAIGQPPIRLERTIAAEILRTISAGWKNAVKSPTMTAQAKEVLITEQLIRGMQQTLKSGGRRREPEMYVQRGTETISHSGVAVPDGRTDISIFVLKTARFYQEDDPHAIIECKRVSGAKTRLCREYINEGIDRFRIGKYAPNHKMGFMIGYLITGDARSAANCINRQLGRKFRTGENLGFSDLINEPWAWQSKHPREEKEPIELQHVFLVFP